MHRLRDLAIPLANPKMFDKLQFVVAFGSGRVVETSEKWHPGRPVTEYFAEQLLDIYIVGLALCEGNHSKAARFLGMDRKTLDRRLAQGHRIIDGARGH
jgi:DNA-binding NtrC family response regulator